MRMLYRRGEGDGGRGDDGRGGDTESEDDDGGGKDGGGAREELSSFTSLSNKSRVHDCKMTFSIAGVTVGLTVDAGVPIQSSSITNR